jgi:hypothetical protein
VELAVGALHIYCVALLQQQQQQQINAHACAEDSTDSAHDLTVILLDGEQSFGHCLCSHLPSMLQHQLLLLLLLLLLRTFIAARCSVT